MKQARQGARASAMCCWRRTQAQGKKLFVAWYKEHATVWLTRQATRWSPRLAAKPKAVQLCDLSYRWGSCDPDGTLQFHWQTILLPPNIVEYVLVHEMVHLHEPNHGKAFWRRLARAMPDCQRPAPKGSGLVRASPVDQTTTEEVAQAKLLYTIESM